MAGSSSETTELRLDADTIGAVDASDLLSDIVGLPEHLRDERHRAWDRNAQHRVLADVLIDRPGAPAAGRKVRRVADPEDDRLLAVDLHPHRALDDADRLVETEPPPERTG